MGQVGHTDPGLTLRIYAQVIGADRSHGGEVDRLVGAAHWARMGTSGPLDDELSEGEPGPETRKTRLSGPFTEADDGTRTHDLLHGKQTL